MVGMWDERYSEAAFVYGTEPNAFLREHAGKLASPVLSLGEGEGRNGVFLATLGLDVTGVDQSEVGLRKAQSLAASRGVTIHTIATDMTQYDPGEATFGSVVSIFAHLPSIARRALHGRVLRCLRPGGVFLLEAYTPEQAPRDTGGPSDPDMCVTLASLREEFAGCELVWAREMERSVVEGRYHTGEASVVQFIARKPG